MSIAKDHNDECIEEAPPESVPFLPIIEMYTHMSNAKTVYIHDCLSHCPRTKIKL